MSQQATLKIKAWREDPVRFVRECFGAEPDNWQADILMAFRDNKRLAMKAAKGCGKSTVLSWCAWNFLATRLKPKIAATSITSDNLSDGLWPEMSKWQSKSPFLKETFTWTKTRIFANASPEEWWMSARTWPKSADSDKQADTLAGLHADYLLFILDEVGGIPDSVMAAAEAGLATGKETKIIMAGNPTHLDGPLYRACTSERHLWYMAQITGDPDDPKRSNRIDINWARDQIQKYGKDNPWVLVNVFGQFPPTSLNTLLGPEEVEAAMKRRYKDQDYVYSQKRLGCDVAREGDDRTVIFPRQGLMAFKPVVMRSQYGPDIAARIMSARAKWGSEIEFIDDTGGWAGSVIDSVKQAGHNLFPINFAGKAIDPRYLNKRAEMWFEMAQWVKRGGALPNLPELMRELVAPTYTFQNGKFQIEPKDQIKKRLGYSPDCFVAGTMITTPYGKKPIEIIKVGDKVLTPMGPRAVIKTWESETNSLTTMTASNGSVLIGKGKHEVFTWDKGWVRLDKLSNANLLESDNLWSLISWSLRRLFTTANPLGFKRLVDIISPTKKILKRDFYIEGYGLTTLVQYLTDFIFTIRTATGPTVNKRPTINLIKTLLFVRSAVGRLLNINIGSKRIAPINVQTQTVVPTKVYNLTLDLDNVYYANGLLVSNCADALALSFALPDRPAQTGFEWLTERKNKALSEYNPYSEENLNT
jgi:hypothetical protein